ncbi:MAG: hypothetical protein WKF81_13685 [Thermomicrobiales bacterium]
MLITLAFVAFGAMIASWLFVPEKSKAATPATIVTVPAASAAD